MKMSESDKVVPFGKYKGRPIVEVIETDPAYLQWLTAQDWFRANYVTLHQTIINRGAETEETPDHNALQVMFLDDDFCLRFCRAHTSSFDEDVRERLEHCRAPDQFSFRHVLGHHRGAIEAMLAKPISTIKTTVHRDFEVRGVDVELRICFESPDHSIEWVSADYSYKIEIKPTVGDDYPAVLRQMKRNESKTLFLKDYIGVGATKEQFIKTFAASGFNVVFLRDCQ
jgi:uncharacterized protein (DUF3820 family)